MTGIAADTDGNIFVADGRRVRQIGPNGVIDNYMGTNAPPTFGDKSRKGKIRKLSHLCKTFHLLLLIQNYIDKRQRYKCFHLI